jgi:hypothetical protein
MITIQAQETTIITLLVKDTESTPGIKFEIIVLEMSSLQLLFMGSKLCVCCHTVFILCMHTIFILFSEMALMENCFASNSVFGSFLHPRP